MARRMSENRTHLRAFALLGLVMVFWAGNSIVGRAVRGEVPAFTLAFIRWTGASLVLWPFAARSVWRDRHELLAKWPAVLLLGLIGIGAFNGLLYNSLKYTTATNALLLQAAIPALVVAFDRLFFGTRADPLHSAGVALSIVGVAVIVFQGDPALALKFHFGFGDALMLVACVVWALYTVLLRLRPKVAGESFVAVTFAIGVLTMAPFAGWEWLQGERIQWSLPVLGAFFFVCLFPSLFSYFMYNWATAEVGPASAGQSITLMPLFGALLSAALLGEPLYGYHWAGMALILAGIVISVLAVRRMGAGKAPASAAPE
jgi:drug/metabolite transporter (DMT)-like permease